MATLIPPDYTGQSRFVKSQHRSFRESFGQLIQLFATTEFPSTLCSNKHSDHMQLRQWIENKMFLDSSFEISTSFVFLTVSCPISQVNCHYEVS